jgi:hypothetical protein
MRAVALARFRGPAPRGHLHSRGAIAGPVGGW